MAEVLYPELSYAVQGAFFDVHNQLHGFDLSEQGWERALLIALAERGIPAQNQVEYELRYGEHRVGRFFVDVIVDDTLLLELKVTDGLLPIHAAQTITYLRVTGLKLGILVNFGEPRVVFKRIPNTVSPAQSPPSEMSSGAPPPEGILHPALTEAVRAAVYTVHSTLGPGFMHMHYRRATQLELRARGIGYQLHKKVTITYRGRPIESRDTRLLIVEGKLLLVCVAVSAVSEQMRVRMRQYLNHFGLQLGLIANFHGPAAELITVRLPEEANRSP